MHTLMDCAGFWELVTPGARCWLTLLRTQGVGFGLVAALMHVVLGLLELAATSLYEELPVSYIDLSMLSFSLLYLWDG